MLELACVTIKGIVAEVVPTWGCYRTEMAKPEFIFRYKVRNWPAYNRALIRRGQLTLWFDARSRRMARHGLQRRAG